MKDQYGFYNPPSIWHPDGQEYDAMYERFERESTINMVNDLLDSYFPTDNADVMEHVQNAKQAILDRDSTHFGNSIIAACRLLGTEQAIEDTDAWADSQASQK